MCIRKLWAVELELSFQKWILVLDCIILLQEIELEIQNRKKFEKEYLKLNEILEAEKTRHKQIVLFLLAERKKIIMKYVEERKRSEDLAQVQFPNFSLYQQNACFWWCRIN